jgi:hypothetical protein
MTNMNMIMIVTNMVVNITINRMNMKDMILMNRTKMHDYSGDNNV